MDNKSFLYFAIGAIVGASVTWYFTKKKYEEIANQEIESVKGVFSKKEENLNPEKSEEISTDPIAKKPDISVVRGISNEHRDYSSILKKEGYILEESAIKEEKDIYVLPPEKFGEIPDYEVLTLTYYRDGILTDEDNEPIEDIVGLIGPDALKCFGVYEEDCVYVRNDHMYADYEILLDHRKYEESL